MHEKLLIQAKEQMLKSGLASLDSKGVCRTIFTRDCDVVGTTSEEQRDIVGVSPRDLGPTKKQAVSRTRRDMIRQERRKRYRQIVSGTYESGLKFDLTAEENYGEMLKINEEAPKRVLEKLGVDVGSAVLLVNSSSKDSLREGRVVKILTNNGKIAEARVKWLSKI